MLKYETTLVSISNRNKSYYEKLGYLIDDNKIIIKTVDLPINFSFKN